MEKRLLIFVVFLFLCPQVHAATVTQPIQVTIDSIVFPEQEYTTPAPSIDYFPGPRVGDVFSGAAIYDDAGIPESGGWIIGHSGDEALYSAADAYQNFSLDWVGVTDYGWMMDTGYPPNYLAFNDGRLSGIHSIYHADFWGGLENEGFLGTEYTSWGQFMWWEEGDLIEKYSAYDLTGTLNPSVPLPPTLILLGSGILGLVAFRPRRPKH